jgi:hypothetical protein
MDSAWDGQQRTTSKSAPLLNVTVGTTLCTSPSTSPSHLCKSTLHPHPTSILSIPCSSSPPHPANRLGTGLGRPKSRASNTSLSRDEAVNPLATLQSFRASADYTLVFTHGPACSDDQGKTMTPSSSCRGRGVCGLQLRFVANGAKA